MRSKTFATGLQQRSAAAVADRLGPLGGSFSRRTCPNFATIAASVSSNYSLDTSSNPRLPIFPDIDSLQESSQRIFDEEVDRVLDHASRCLSCAVSIGTAIFWFLMAGPIVALYRGYFDASYGRFEILPAISSGFLALIFR